MMRSASEAETPLPEVGGSVRTESASQNQSVAQEEGQAAHVSSRPQSLLLGEESRTASTSGTGHDSMLGASNFKISSEGALSGLATSSRYNLDRPDFMPGSLGSPITALPDGFSGDTYDMSTGSRKPPVTDEELDKLEELIAAEAAEEKLAAQTAIEKLAAEHEAKMKTASASSSTTSLTASAPVENFRLGNRALFQTPKILPRKC